MMLDMHFEFEADLRLLGAQSAPEAFKLKLQQ